MINFNETTISDLIFHRFSMDENNCIENNNLYEYQNEEEENILRKIFIKPFTSNFTTFEFKHDIDISLNPLFQLSKFIYEDENFIDKSKEIFTHLKNVSKHPNIKDGDLFIIKYNDVKLDNIYYEALGIYKIENKESYIEIIQDNRGKVKLNFRKGIGERLLDKACLIIFNKKPYTISIIDNGSKETDYWKNEFLNVISKNDSINNTDQFLSLTKSFINKKYSEPNISKVEKSALLNKSYDFFKNKESFDIKEFEEEVMKDSNIIEEFNEYKKNYEKNHHFKLNNDFKIATEAVKKQSQFFKSKIKLDKNFDIYVHGDSKLIQRGIESDGRKYYKIYYKEEL